MTNVMAVIFSGALGLYVLYSLAPSIISFLNDAKSAANDQNSQLLGLTFLIFLLVIVGAMAKKGDLI